VGVNGADPRRVDQHKPCVQQLVIELDVRRFDAAVVSRVARFGHVVGELRERPLLLAAVVEGDRKPIPLPGSDCDHNRRQGNHAGRKQVPPEQGVDQRALAALELPEHHEVESILGDPLARCGKMPARGLGQERFAKRKQLIDGAQTECPLAAIPLVTGRRNARSLGTTQNRWLHLTSTFVNFVGRGHQRPQPRSERASSLFAKHSEPCHG
jgi:hypothetical protein